MKACHTLKVFHLHRSGVDDEKVRVLISNLLNHPSLLTLGRSSFISTAHKRLRRFSFYSVVFHLSRKTGKDVYVVVQFCPWFKFYFLLFWGMVIYDNEFENISRINKSIDHTIC